MKTVIAFYIALILMLAGFAAAGPTAGAPWAVVTGWLGLFGTIAATVARIEGATASTGHARRFR